MLPQRDIGAPCRAAVLTVSQLQHGSGALGTATRLSFLYADLVFHSE